MATLQEALAKMLRVKKKSTDEEAAEAKAGAEKVSKIIPEGAFPHEALRKKKKQMADMDEQTKE